MKTLKEYLFVLPPPKSSHIRGPVFKSRLEWRERDRETETETETDRQTERDRDRDRDRETETETDRDRQTDKVNVTNGN